MMKILVADDEPLLRAELCEQLRALWHEPFTLIEAENGDQAAQRIANDAPDIAFLDIKMPGQTGLEVASGIEGATRVVFVTAYDQYALQAFENAAVDYVLKPVSAERLQKTIARLRQPAMPANVADVLRTLLQTSTSDAVSTAPKLRWLRASQGDTTYQIAVDDVLYFQSDNKYTAIHTGAGEHLVRIPLSELLAGLDPETFWQIHRGTIVNMRCVHSTRRDADGAMALKLKNIERELVVSRAFQARFRQM
jgi:DNA-binding LytR/AlgR family response regulator